MSGSKILECKPASHEWTDLRGKQCEMNIRIICVGKLKEKYWRDAVAEYMKRLSAYAKMEIVELKESRSDDIEEEGGRILSALGVSDNLISPGTNIQANKNRSAVITKMKSEIKEYVITLEIQGKELSSEQLAEKIGELGLEGKSDVALVIGGSCGLSAAVSSIADMKLSFSKMTFPHQMMRVILLEQIYRSFKIIRKES
jgi:23S rRNA (pseudouridine1915-N3)-methyltransferase